MFELIYELCNKNGWFTCGTNHQYEKMFDCAKKINVDSGCFFQQIRRVAVIIWVCSDDKFTENEIFETIVTAISEACGFSEGDINAE